MQQFVARENVRHLEAALGAAKSADEKRQITALLAEARARLVELEQQAGVPQRPSSTSLDPTAH